MHYGSIISNSSQISAYCVASSELQYKYQSSCSINHKTCSLSKLVSTFENTHSHSRIRPDNQVRTLPFLPFFQQSCLKIPFFRKSGTRMLLSNSIAVSLRTSLTPGAARRRNAVVLAQQNQPQQLTATTSFPGLTISDEALTSRGFSLHRTIDSLNLDQLNSVFVAVGFPRRDTDKIRVALEHTDALLWIEHEKTKRPVAFARATGDGVFNAIIWDVVVDPSFQGLGLGKAVMERLVNDLLAKGISNIALYSEPRVLGFYKPLGFVADPDGIRGMVYSRKQKKKR